MGRDHGHASSGPVLMLLPLLGVYNERGVRRFWSSRREGWPRMVQQSSSVARVFGSQALERYRWDLTLLEATERNDDANDPFSGLLKQSTAALLNSYARDGFPYTSWEIKTLLIQALVSEQAAARLAQRFSRANQACT